MHSRDGILKNFVFVTVDRFFTTGHQRRRDIHTPGGKDKKQNLTASPLPSMRSSCPWEPTSVLDRNGAKSTMISRKRGDTDPKAISSFWVREASRDGVGMGKSE